jgi:hypothetical protein
MSEDQFCRLVIRFAQLHKWRVAHFRPARTGKGWRTPCQGDAKGFPDLLLVKGPRLLAVELKVGKNKLTQEQFDWLSALMGARVETHVWRPEHWSEIEAVLGA